MRRYSSSQLDDFATCPWRALRNRQGDRSAPTHALQVGTLFHKWVEEAIPFKEARNRAIAIELLRGAAIALGTDLDAYDDCVSVVDAWLDAREVDQKFPMRGVAEWQFGFSLAWNPVDFNSDKARFRGSVDYHEVHGDTAILVDYKTGHHIPSEINWNQLIRYAWALGQAHPKVKTFQLTYDYARTGWRPTTTVTREEIAAVPADLTAQMRAADALLDRYLETGVMPAKQNQFCGFCSHRATCPALWELLQIRTVNSGLMPAASISDATTTSHTIKLLEAALADAKAAMKTWTTERGPVPVEGEEGKVWQSSNSARQGRPVQTLRKMNASR